MGLRLLGVSQDKAVIRTAVALHVTPSEAHLVYKNVEQLAAGVARDAIEPTPVVDADGLVGFDLPAGNDVEQGRRMARHHACFPEAVLSKEEFTWSLRVNPLAENVGRCGFGKRHFIGWGRFPCSCLKRVAPCAENAGSFAYAMHPWGIIHASGGNRS